MTIQNHPVTGNRFVLYGLIATLLELIPVKQYPSPLPAIRYQLAPLIFWRL